MGVYIPKMKMPEHCGECRFAVDGWCYAYGKPNIDALANDGRTNFCPLIEVPPHGDLVDRQRMAETNEQHYKIYEGEPSADYARHVVLRMLDQAPIVIPAEEGEI